LHEWPGTLCLVNWSILQTLIQWIGVSFSICRTISTSTTATSQAALILYSISPWLCTTVLPLALVLALLVSQKNFLNLLLLCLVDIGALNGNLLFLTYLMIRICRYYWRLRNILAIHYLILLHLLLVFHCFLLSCLYTHWGGEHLVVLVEHVFGSLNLIMNRYLLAQYLIANLPHHVSIWIKDHFLGAAHTSTIVVKLNWSKVTISFELDIVCFGIVFAISETKLRLILLMLLWPCTCSSAKMINLSIILLIHKACSLRSILRYADLAPTVDTLNNMGGLVSILHICNLSWSLATTLSYSLNSRNYFFLIPWYDLLLVWLLWHFRI